MQIDMAAMEAQLPRAAGMCAGSRVHAKSSIVRIRPLAFG
jgi:hypothetical protein